MAEGWTDTEIVDAALYVDGIRSSTVNLSDCKNLVRPQVGVIWIGLHEPSQALLQLMQRQFRLHDLAIEDALEAHQRPKLEVYGETLFIVVRTAQRVDGEVAFGETHIFVGRGFVITVRHGPSSSYAPVRRRCEADSVGMSQGEDFILHAVLDFIVDNYVPVVEAIEQRVEAIEERVFSQVKAGDTARDLYSLRRQLIRLRNVTMPLMDVCRALQEPHLPGIDEHMRPLFRDIADHLRRVQEQIDSARETLTFAFEASVVAGQVGQTEITRKLAAWAAILAVPTAIAGIYGMNFEHMPELKWRHGYFATLVVIAALCITLIVYFRRKRWL